MGWISVADTDPEGSKTFGRIRSGPEINVSDPDSNPDSNPEPKLDPKKYEKTYSKFTSSRSNRSTVENF
jgi:hypothetical protein